jgi:hypothetical protein
MVNQGSGDDNRFRRAFRDSPFATALLMDKIVSSGHSPAHAAVSPISSFRRVSQFPRRSASLSAPVNLTLLRRWFDIPLWVMVLLAIFLRSAGAWRTELWLDELHSALICLTPVHEWIEPGALGAYTPLYFLLSAPFMVPGMDFLARIPSLAAGAALIVLVARFLEHHESPVLKSSAGLAALLLALNPSLVIYSGAHRMYALFVLAVTAMYMTFESSRPGSGARFVISTAAAFLTFPVAAFYSAAFLLIGLASPRARTRALLGFGIVFVLALCYSWNGLMSLRHETLTSGPVRFPPLDGTLYLRLPMVLLSGPIGPTETVLRVLRIPLLLLGWAALFTGFIRGLRGESVLVRLIVIAIFPPLMEAFLLPFGVKMFQYKSYLPSAVFLTILAAVTLRGAERSASRVVATGAVIFVLASSLIIDLAWMDPARPFNMKERRDVVQAPLHEMTRSEMSFVDGDSRLLPLVLSEPTFALGGIWYGQGCRRDRYVPLEALSSFTAKGKAFQLILNGFASNGIRVVPESAIPSPALWMVRSETREPIARTPAGFSLEVRE